MRDKPRSVTVRGTEQQMDAWETAGRRHGNRTAGAFLAWSGDVAVVILDALHEFAVREGLKREDG
jgi:hypothetical protein